METNSKIHPENSKQSSGVNSNRCPEITFSVDWLVVFNVIVVCVTYTPNVIFVSSLDDSFVLSDEPMPGTIDQAQDAHPVEDSSGMISLRVEFQS